MKGVPTFYRDVWFRSRTEARWALFFDNVRLKWAYEPLRIPGYLVDFHLPELDCYVEIKNEANGRFPRAEEIGKARALSRFTRKPVYVFFGDLTLATLNRGSALRFDCADTEFSTRHFFCECPACHALDITPEGRTEGHRCGCVLPFGAVDGTGGIIKKELRRARDAFVTRELKFKFKRVNS